MLKQIVQNKCKKIELLSPAGNLEKLKIAINYGADAVYLAGKHFNLRNFSENFTRKEMEIARNITFKKNVKMYIAVNTYSRDREDKAILKYLLFLKSIKPDGIIVADPAIFVQVKKLMPKTPIHVSTQSNITNSRTALFWEKLGVKRINVARELSLKEVQTIISNSKIEIETFVHGAMCMAYSGKCLMSNFMNQRESNQGKCCQPCRFNYKVVEEKRPGEFFPIYEDKLGSYIFSSKDLCMIDHVSDLIDTGITSLKIEGRMKSIYYVATTTKTYREAIDTYYEGKPLNYDSLLKNWHNNLKKINNRGYSTGFFFGNLNQTLPNFAEKKNFNYTFVAKVLKETRFDKTLINVRNKICQGDRIEIVSPKRLSDKKDVIQKITNEKGEHMPVAQPGSNVIIKTKTTCKALDLIRKKTKKNEI